MSFDPGTRLGSYEIKTKLGAGGMGEVYRATDGKLKREVAIKVLPAAFLQDADRLERFEREAQILAQLHHPNIASIFGLEESNGVRALVMEMVEGQDLSSIIERGPMPLTDALAVARQIAEALEAAHGTGIVHRDLKPANVKVKADGAVKVLDFGLAKAMEPAAISGGDLANSPTLTGRATQLGMIMGTAAYMAPEQARGSAVDKRADVWAFGVVLYEMLTADRLFDGESAVDTLSAVMRKEIDLGRLPAGTPAELRRLLRRCLERNAKNRLHDIADARIVIDEVMRGGGEDAPVAAAAAAAPRTSWIPLASIAVLALMLGAGAGWLSRRPTSVPSGPAPRWALAIPDGYTLSTGDFPQLAISEDGRLQAVVVTDESLTPQILVRSSDQVEPRILPETSGANTPFFSPDGRWIGFFRGRGLYKVPVAGGPPVELAPVVSELARGGTWSRDGFIYFTRTVNVGMSRVPEGGGAVTETTSVNVGVDQRTHRWPQALPDGSAILFTVDSFDSTEYYDDARIEAIRPATGERKVLIEGASQARYAGGNRLVFGRGGSLYAVEFDAKSLTVRGAPELVLQGVATDVGSGAVQFALSPSGAALWAPGSLSARYALSWADRHGVDTRTSVADAPYNEAELSPDGKRVALVGGTGGSSDLLISDLDRGTQSRLTSGLSTLNPTWSPDGKQIAYVVRTETPSKERRWQIVLQPADGSRDATKIFESDEFLTLGDFTPDGRQIVFTSQVPGGGKGDILTLPVTGGTPTTILSDAFNKREAVVSPDGRYLAYVSNEGGTGQVAVYIRPFPAGDGRWIVSPPISLEPRWSPDGRELFFRSRALLYRVAIETRGGFSPGKAEVLFDRVSNGGGVKTYRPAPDGRFFTFRTPAGRGSMRTVNLDLGFAERIEKR